MPKSKSKSPRRPDAEPAPIAESATPASRRLEWAAPLVLVAVAALAYHNSLTGPFIFDDISNVRTNFQMRRLWPIWDAMWGPLGTGVSGRPIVQLSFAVDYAIHGLDVVGYHVTNLLLHAVTSLLLFGVIRLTLAARPLAGRFSLHATPLALLVAIVWQVHPLLSDSVTYISGRTEILAALFILLTLYCVIRGTRSPGRGGLWKCAAVVACVLGTGCKEIMAAAPVLVLLYDRMFIADSAREIIRRRGVLYAALFASLLLIPLNLKMADFHRSALATQDTLSSWQYLKIQSEVLVLYLRLSVWPDPLVIDYAGWPTDASLASVLPEASLIVLLLLATLFGLFRRKPAAYAGAWFFFILAPTSSILPLPTEIATERRMYLPLMGIVALLVLGVYRMMTSASRRFPAARRGMFLGASVAVILVVGAEMLRTVWRNEDYKNPLGVWADVVNRRPTNSRAHNNLGLELLARGYENDAKPLFMQAVRLDPSNYTALNNLATVDMNQSNYPEAIASLETAIRIKPDYPPPYVNLSLVCYDLGRFEEAERFIRTAIRLQPERLDRLPILARILAARGELDAAQRLCRTALRSDPRSAVAHDQLGMVLAELNQLPEAIAELRTAVELSPADSEFMSHLAWQLAAAEDASIRNPQEALALARRAVEATRGGNAIALDALALAYAADGQFEPAGVAARRALEIAKARQSPRAGPIERRLAAYTAGRMPDTQLRRFNPTT